MSESGSHSVAVALLAHLLRARDHIDRNYREPLDLDGLRGWRACVEAVMRENTGNWAVLVEPREFAPENFE